MKKIRVRFAPSPTGLLHVGNARTALFNWLFARQKKGDFILRVEDTDVARSSSEYAEKLISDLKWLGLDWEEGPDAGGKYGPYLQSLRLDIYKSYTQSLIKEQKAYYCFCSREELEEEKKHALAQGKMPVYSEKCRSIPLKEALKKVEDGEPAAVRLKTPHSGNLTYEDLVRGRVSFDLKLLGDPVLVRPSGLPAYNYAVVIDDSLMEITHVIRGEDHISNMPRQILTYRALSFQVPRFAHLSMVMGKDNARLSKRHGATSVGQFQKEGILPVALVNYLALLGWAPPDGQEVLKPDELISLFDITKVSKSSSIFDYEKLYWLNRQHMKKLSLEEQSRRSYPYLLKAGLLPRKENMSDAHWTWLGRAVSCFIEKVDRFVDLPAHFDTLFSFSLDDLDDEAKNIMSTGCAQKVIKAAARRMQDGSRLDFEKFAQMTKEIKTETGCKGKDLFRPLRVAMTAQPSGLDLNRFIPLVEEGALLTFPRPLLSCTQRIMAALDWYQRMSS